MSQTRGIQILHVDDDPDFADVTAEFLEREDDRFAVETATSASEGLDRLAADDFDCIVSDYDMPGQDGIEFLETVREDYPELPFILYTGKGSEEVASDAISAGVTDYLQKGSGTDQYTVLANRMRNAVERYRAQQARDRQHEAIESAREGISILNEDGEFIYVNEAYADLYGYDPEEMLGEPWELIYPGDEVAFARDEILPTVADEGYWHGETTGLRADGTTFPEDHVVSQTNDDEMVCTVRDLSDRRERETELRIKTRAMDEAPVGITITDPGQEDNPLIYVNDRFEEMTGYDREEIIGRNCRFLQGEDTAEEPVADMRQAIDAQEPVTVELRNYRNDGTEFWNRVTIAPVETEACEVTNWVGFQEAITERKDREQAIEELHTTAREFMEAGTADDVAETAVHAAETILDLPASAIHLYDEDDDCLPPVAWTDPVEEIIDTPPTFSAGDGLAWEVFETGEPQVYADVSTVSGRRNPDTDVRSQIILPLGDHGVFLIGSETPDEFDDTDISLAEILTTHVTTALDRIEHEQTLQEERDFIEQALDALDDLFYCVGTDGTLRRWNDHVSEVTGYTDEELADMHATDLFPEDEQATVADGIEEALTAGEAIIEADLLTKDGERVPHEFTGARLTDTDGDVIGLIGIGRDITERKRREDALEQLHAATREVMAATTTDEIASLGSETATQVLELPINGVHLADEDDEVLTPVAWSEETEAFFDGPPPALPVADSLAGEVYQTGEPHNYANLHEADAPFNPETDVRSELHVPIGEHGVLVAGSTTPDDFDATDETLAQILATNLESALNRVEREQERQRQNERLEQFTSVVSHDLRNPLQVADSRVELAQSECDCPHLDDIAAALDRMETLIDDLLTLAQEGKQVQETEPVVLAEMVEGCWQSVQTADATLVCDTPQRIQADPSRLKQLLENLFRNAVEHAGDDVTITVGELDDGDGFYVADDGPGIPADERDEVFDAGYSTTDEGTGFGLNIVQEIAEAHGWEITVTDSEMGGARFEITGLKTAAA